MDMKSFSERDIAEQQRIVNKGGELTAWCDEPETATRFANALATLRSAAAVAQT